MTARTSRTRIGSRNAVRGAAIGAGLCLVLATSLVLGQTLPERQIHYVSTLEAPQGLSQEAFRLPPSPLDVRAALAVARRGGQQATAEAQETLPALPWGRHGLADVAIAPERISWNEDRSRYEATLDDGRVAVLTLDRGIQRHLEGLVRRHPEPGQAVVVVEPHTGRVLGMADNHSDERIGPHLARRSTAFAASVFKVITAAALIDVGAVTPQTTRCFTGGSSGFVEADLTANAVRDNTCWDFTQAMARSANIIFARLADEHLTPLSLEAMAERFAFNAHIPFEMPVETSRVAIPSERIEFARAAAGFRHSTMSPLHGALIQAAIANQGVMMVPTIVASIEEEGAPVYVHEPVVWRRVLSTDANRMLDDTQSTTCTIGTARNYFQNRSGWPAAIRVHGKTGTLSNRPAHGVNPEVYFLYTWFAGHGFRDDRRVAASGLVVNTPTWWIRGSFLASEALLSALR